jgi:hypothetical protein
VDVSLWAAVISTVGALAGAIFAIWFGYTSARRSAQRETAERQRLSSEVFGQPAPAYTSAPPAGEAPPGEAPPGEAPPGEAPPGQKAWAPPRQAPSEENAPSRDAVYDQLLVNDYALGLTQARVAFNVSMSFSILGGLVLVLGVALAIFRADTGGQVAGAAITSAAGVLTSGLSQLFRGQSTKTLKHLESQAVELRKDVRARINAGTAERLLGEISDSHLRRLQAALILEFTGAKLPDLDRALQPAPGTLNGSARSSEFIEPASSSS